MKKQKGNSQEGITWSEMGKQNVQAKELYYDYSDAFGGEFVTLDLLHDVSHFNLHSFLQTLILAFVMKKEQNYLIEVDQNGTNIHIMH